MSNHLTYHPLHNTMAEINFLQGVFAEKGVRGVIEELQKGNERFAKSKQLHPRADAAARENVVAGQKPVATVLACSDSRAPVELLFDCGIGDLFIIRTAGHVLSESTLASLEYAAEHLKTPLFIVLGHQKCGAVNASHDTEDTSGCSKPMAALIQQIKPAVEAAKEAGGDRETVIRAATLGHVQNTINTIKDKLGHILEENQLSIVGGFYNLDSGKIDFYEDYGVVRE